MTKTQKQKKKSKRSPMSAMVANSRSDTRSLVSELGSSPAAQSGSLPAPHVSEFSQVSEELEGYESLQYVKVIASPVGSAHPALTKAFDPFTHSDRYTCIDENQIAWNNREYEKLSLETFVGFAAAAAHKEAEEHPNRSAIWEFARFCKKHPVLADLSGESAFDLIPWEDTTFSDFETEQFITCYDTVLFAAGEGPVDLALREADDHPLRQTNRKIYDRFVSMAGWLQHSVGDKAILLPQKLLAEKLKVPPSLISNMTNQAIKNGYLTCVKKAIPKRQAALYRFDLKLLPRFAGRHDPTN